MEIQPSFSLTGRTIVITGASSGIGKQCAINCSQQGAKVILLGRDENRLMDTMNKLSNTREKDYFAFDLTDYKIVDSFVQDLFDKHGKIDGLINAAGISTTLPFKLMTPEKMNHFYNVNVTASMNLTRLLTQKKIFSEKGGAIVFISSVMGVVGETGKALYALTKGAINAGVKSLALELAKRKIRVNCVSPGVVETPMSKRSVYSQDEELLNKVRNMHPLGLGQPEDIANVCVFLLSDSARWITGTNIIVDGGYTAR